MINCVDSILNFNNLLNDINEKLKLNESLIKYQNEEILKTEAFISQFNDCLKSQNDVLKVFVSDNVKLKEEQSKYIKLMKDEENSKNQIQLQSSFNPDLQMINGEISDSFNETYEISQTTKSLKFYRAISNQLSLASPSTEINYLNQTMIPNILKTQTDIRRMYIKTIDKVGEYNFENIIGQSIEMPIDLHVAEGAGELLSLRGPKLQVKYHATTIRPCKSFSILQTQTICTRFILLVNKTPMIIALDIHNTNQTSPESSFFEKLPLPEGYTFSVPKITNAHQPSFLRKPLLLEEVRSRLLFIDASFAEDINGYFVPIALAVLDYHGNFLINTIMCPRVIIRHYHKEKHGLLESDIIGTPDIQQVLEYFYNIILDKVIVGYDLVDKIKDLKINTEYLCGIRDLKGSQTVREIINPLKNSFNLVDIAKRILNEQLIDGVYSASRNVCIIRRVYMNIESQWKDTVLNYDSINNGTSSRSASTKTAPSRWGKIKI